MPEGLSSTVARDPCMTAEAPKEIDNISLKLRDMHKKKQVMVFTFIVFLSKGHLGLWGWKIAKGKKIFANCRSVLLIYQVPWPAAAYMNRNINLKCQLQSRPSEICWRNGVFWPHSTCTVAAIFVSLKMSHSVFRCNYFMFNEYMACSWLFRALTRCNRIGSVAQVVRLASHNKARGKL